MLRHTEITLARIERFTQRLKELVYSSHVPMTAEYAGPVGRISHAEAQKLEYRPAAHGLELGPLWTTYWFRLRGTVPEAWKGQRVDLYWVSHSEATLWRDGQPVQGLNYEPAAPWNASVRPDAKLWDSASGGETISLEVEVACNQVFGYDFRNVQPYKARTPYVFERADLALFNKDAWDLYLDYVVLADLLKCREPGALTPWLGRVLAVLNDVLNELRPEDPGTWPNARAKMQELYSQRNASYAHEISAVGHSHIDTAWLWPVAETKRKCVRTFSSVLAYMEDYPEFKFACSQALQYDWIKQDQPELYERIKAAVQRGQWIPVGGCWIEPDCNIPSGEALVRQILYGKRFFRQEFGVDCKEFWEPDVFGYNGALPQIMREAGFDYFLTQKLSYNEMNKPMHHSFLWEGIDGTRILTHFPPSDTYNAMGIGFPLKDILFGVKNFKDHDRSNQSMLLYGYGDGGGGPTKEMIEAFRRIKDLQGVPRTEQRTPCEFFKRLEENLTDAPVITGELYFELTRGCYTTQSVTKRDNRFSEILLRDIEILSVIAEKSGACSYPREALDGLWKLLLLNHFHDIIPGSSIREVHEESERDFAHILQTGAELKKQALDAIAGGSGLQVFNTCGWDRTDLAVLPQDSLGTPQVSFAGQPLALLSAPSMGTAPVSSPGVPEIPAQIQNVKGLFVLENRYLRAEFNTAGHLIRLFDKENRREVIEHGKPGQFVLFDDNPVVLDAWDVDVFHLETREMIPGAKSARILESGPLRSMVEFQFAFGQSTLTARVSLAAHSRHLEYDCEADWHQRHQLLKMEFPVDVQALEAAFEIQSGYVKRPTHYNTTYDIARFETCGHRWADMSQPDYGVALFTDSKYGYDIHQSVMRISLLRGPTHPDPEADQGAQRFRFACYPHAGDLIQAEVVRRAHEFNCPLAITAGTGPETSWWRLDSPHLILDTIKKAEDSAATVVRLYETHGTRGQATLQSAWPFRKAWLVNLLEEKKSELPIADGRLTLDFKPFQILTILLEP